MIVFELFLINSVSQTEIINFLMRAGNYAVVSPVVGAAANETAFL